MKLPDKPLHTDPDEYLIHWWKKFPEMQLEEFGVLLNIHEESGDFHRMYFEDNNEAQ